MSWKGYRFNFSVWPAPDDFYFIFLFFYLGWALTFRKSLSLLRSNAAFCKYSIFIWHVWVGVIWLIRLTGLFTHTHTDTQTSSSWFIAGNNGLEKIACAEVRAGCVAWKRWGKNKCSPLCSAHIFLLLLVPHSVGQCNTPSPISKKYRKSLHSVIIDTGTKFR